MHCACMNATNTHPAEVRNPGSLSFLTLVTRVFGVVPLLLRCLFHLFASFNSKIGRASEWLCECIACTRRYLNAPKRENETKKHHVE